MFIHADMQHLQKDKYVAFAGPPANPHPSLSKDLWDQLNTLYSPAGIVGQFEAFSEALHIWIQDLNEGHCHGPTSDECTIMSQINKLTSTYNKMTSAGLTLPENLKAMILLNSLLSSYHSLISTIVQTTTAAQFTLDNIIPKIVSEGQLRHTSQSNCQGPAHRMTAIQHELVAAANRTSTIQHTPSKPTCSHCGKSHASDSCWQVYGRPRQSNSQPQQQSSRGHPPDRPNTGSKGTIILQQDKLHAPPIALMEVWYAPEGAHRLLSVTALTNQGFHCEITDKTKIWNTQGRLVM
ncbi:hypothetical protein OG21DRAFT_1527757 [Imleria badia]|nr:hypothetical protein OG21DRAFT_1527757 [Imleria badia]